MNAGIGGRWDWLFWSDEKEIEVSEDISEDVVNIEVAEKIGVEVVTVCRPEEAKLVVTVERVEVGELVGVVRSSSISIIRLVGLPGITGRGKVEAMGVESSLPWGTGCIPLWAATVSVKVAVISSPELPTRLTRGRPC